LPATVEVDVLYGDTWRPLTVLDSHVTPGAGTIRIRFSKPVRLAEVEQALLAAQAAPVRGALQWEDDRTVHWQIARLPDRIDFLLGGAHDQDGLPLPGGIPSLRVGEPATLVELDLSGGVARSVAVLPPDIIRAALSADGKDLNLTAWSPGTTRWDWRITFTSCPLMAPTHSASSSALGIVAESPRKRMVSGRKISDSSQMVPRSSSER
jgi:hypothetical protein